ncbi:MAG: YbaB/EbfC family nucleoid-associated protein [Mycobacteriaceae bacterium]
MTECAGDPRQWVRDYSRRIEEIARRASVAQEAVKSARGKAVSGNGAITVEVGSGGRVEVLDIKDSALRLKGSRLSELIRATILDAQRDAAKQIQLSVREITGDTAALEYIKGFMDVSEDVEGSTSLTELSDDDDDFRFRKGLLR